jgi:hypothetical protein
VAHTRNSMSTNDRSPVPLGDLDWVVTSGFPTFFCWDYEDARPALVQLYAKGKRLQWNADDRIDWSQDLDPENPMQIPDLAIPIYGSKIWNDMDEPRRAELRRHAQAWQLSQFLHGEQGALICTAKIVQQVPTIDAKFYAATQVMDEARHVEVYAKLLHEKFEVAYPIAPTLKSLLQNVIEDSRWDFTYLGMQILIEGLALAAFANIRDTSQSDLTRQVHAYVMQDEARHVAFGRLALRDYYPELNEKERDEREEFAVEASYAMRDRLQAREVFRTLDLPEEECVACLERSELMRRFRANLFSRIVPPIKQIGLWGPRMRRAYEEMGVLGYADVDLEALSRDDDRIASTVRARDGGTANAAG